MVVGAAYVIKICPINSIRSVFTPYGPYGAIHDSHQVQIPHVTLSDLHLESCFSLAALVSVLQLVWCSRGMHPSYTSTFKSTLTERWSAARSVVSKALGRPSPLPTTILYVKSFWKASTSFTSSTIFDNRCHIYNVFCFILGVFC